MAPAAAVTTRFVAPWLGAIPRAVAAHVTIAVPAGVPLAFAMPIAIAIAVTVAITTAIPIASTIPVAIAARTIGA